MSTGRWAWLSEINLRLLRTKNSQDQSFQPLENIACPNLGNIRKTQDVPLRPPGLTGGTDLPFDGSDDFGASPFWGSARTSNPLEHASTLRRFCT